MHTSVLSPAVNILVSNNKSAAVKKSVFSRFLSWCETQEEYRFLWLGITFFGLIGLALPVTLYAILFLGHNALPLWIATVVINVPVLALTLAAQPTKITLPCLLSACVLDVTIIATSIVIYFLG